MAFITVRRSVASVLYLSLATVCLVGVTPASATTGREAVGMCIDSTATGARCGWAVSKDGSIDICNKNGCVTCPSAEGTCTVAKIKPKHLNTVTGPKSGARLKNALK
jgi:hypothetical protein